MTDRTRPTGTVYLAPLGSTPLGLNTTGNMVWATKDDDALHVAPSIGRVDFIRPPLGYRLPVINLCECGHTDRQHLRRTGRCKGLDTYDCPCTCPSHDPTPDD